MNSSPPPAAIRRALAEESRRASVRERPSLRIASQTPAGRSTQQPLLRLVLIRVGKLFRLRGGQIFPEDLQQHARRRVGTKRHLADLIAVGLDEFSMGDQIGEFAVAWEVLRIDQDPLQLLAGLADVLDL